MAENSSHSEQNVASLFRAGSAGPADNDRVERIMSRVRVEIASRDIFLFLFVRLWLSVLEFGAFLFTRRPQQHQLAAKRNMPPH
ncbi:MAG: hypothetical protein ACI8XZ_005368 [Gammaproteobacteria bacterium]|jgi:hypothetical protein